MTGPNGDSKCPSQTRRSARARTLADLALRCELWGRGVLEVIRVEVWPKSLHPPTWARRLSDLAAPCATLGKMPMWESRSTSAEAQINGF